MDALAGLSVAAMAVPQCVCFAGMAGLPASYGLYGVIAPALGYAFTGSSPYLVRKQQPAAQARLAALPTQ